MVIKLLSCLLIFAAFMGCAEKKTRIWIEPPVGAEVGGKTNQKIYYQVEDVQSGKKENLIIPLQQVPDNLVVEGNKKPGQSESEEASVTKADRLISDGKLPSLNKDPSAPSISYLRGLAEVESLYQKRKFTEALVRLAPLVEQYPKQTRLFTMQGTLYRRIGENKLAFDAYKRARQLDPNNPALEEAVLRSQDELGG